MNHVILRFGGDLLRNVWKIARRVRRLGFAYLEKREAATARHLRIQEKKIAALKAKLADTVGEFAELAHQVTVDARRRLMKQAGEMAILQAMIDSPEKVVECLASSDVAIRCGALDVLGVFHDDIDPSLVIPILESLLVRDRNVNVRKGACSIIWAFGAYYANHRNEKRYIQGLLATICIDERTPLALRRTAYTGLCALGPCRSRYAGSINPDLDPSQFDWAYVLSVLR